DIRSTPNSSATVCETLPSDRTERLGRWNLTAPKGPSAIPWRKLAGVECKLNCIHCCAVAEPRGRTKFFGDTQGTFPQNLIHWLGKIDERRCHIDGVGFIQWLPTVRHCGLCDWAPRVHHAARRPGGGVVGRGARAAAGDAGRRLGQRSKWIKTRTESLFDHNTEIENRDQRLAHESWQDVARDPEKIASDTRPLVANSRECRANSCEQDLRCRDPPWLAGHVGIELRNVVGKYPFETSHRFPEIKPNSGHRDHSRLGCGVPDTQLVPRARISAG